MTSGHTGCSSVWHTAMEVRDGYIVGIYNYCDGWCDRCAFTSYCQVFADKCELEAALDPSMSAVAEAPFHREEIRSRPRPADAHVRGVPRDVPERDAIGRRSDEYLRRTHAWLQRSERGEWHHDHDDPRSVISWFHLMIHVKTLRALRGLAEDDPADRDWPPDHDGSAKVALIGIDRSYTAWLDLVEVGAVSTVEATPFLDDLLWLLGAVEQTFPKARAFVRPAFDEPDEAARLLHGG
jgi:hypothetical protein